MAGAWRTPPFNHHGLTGAQAQAAARWQKIVASQTEAFAAARAKGHPDPTLADAQLTSLARFQGNGLAGVQAGINARLAVLTGKCSRLGHLAQNRKKTEGSHGVLQIRAEFKRQGMNDRAAQLFSPMKSGYAIHSINALIGAPPNLFSCRLHAPIPVPGPSLPGNCAPSRPLPGT